MDLGNVQHRQRLSDVIEKCYKHLEPNRRVRRMLIEDYAGAYYGSNWAGSRPDVYVNLIQLTAKAYSVGLAYNAPRFHTSTHERALKPFAKRLQQGLNGLSNKIRLENCIRSCVLDAFFNVGIAKVYLGDAAAVDAEIDPDMDPGIPFAGRVSFDNWCHDVGASSWDQCGFMADRYRMRLDDARNSPRFDAKLARQLEPSRKAPWRDNSTLAAGITKDHGEIAEGEFEDMVDLCDVYLPRERKIAVFPCDAYFRIPNQAPLAVMDWVGSNKGPYEILEFTEVPDNLMPASIAGNIHGLFVLFNNLWMKLANRARNQKEVFYYTSGNESDMKRFKNAADQDTIRIAEKDSIGVHAMGGVDGSLAAFAMSVAEVYKQQSGNLDLMAGLGPSSDTLGQDQIVAAQAGRFEADARRNVDGFVSRIGGGLAELMFDDPFLVIPGTQSVEGTGFEVPAPWLPPDMLPREGDFRDYQVQIEPYSMEFKSPMQRLQQLRMSLQGILPFLPQMEQQGAVFNAERYLRAEADLQNLPELVDLFDFNAAPPEPEHSGSQREGMGKGNTGPREYIRRNVSSGPKGAGVQQTLIQQMAHAGQTGGSMGSM